MVDQQEGPAQCEALFFLDLLCQGIRHKTISLSLHLIQAPQDVVSVSILSLSLCKMLIYEKPPLIANLLAVSSPLRFDHC